MKLIKTQDAVGQILCHDITQIIGHEVSDDNHEKITGCIKKLLNAGADMVVCTGGMSVDPDDKTPLAIKNSGANIVTYGAPVLPGAMFLLSYYDGNIPIVGLPGCVMYAKRTIFDFVLPRLMAGEVLKKEDLDSSVRFMGSFVRTTS